MKNASINCVLTCHYAQGRHRLDLRHQQGYPKLCEMVMNNRELIGKPFRAKFTQYDILVSYKRLLTENKVPVGFWRSIARAIFFCKLRHVGPFQRCCRSDMLRQPQCKKAAATCCGKSAVRKPIMWIELWRRIGLALLIVLLPSPYYIRLLILYLFEYDEVSGHRRIDSAISKCFVSLLRKDRVEGFAYELDFGRYSARRAPFITNEEWQSDGFGAVRYAGFLFRGGRGG
jgi:hypothetical protein